MIRPETSSLGLQRLLSSTIELCRASFLVGPYRFGQNWPSQLWSAPPRLVQSRCGGLGLLFGLLFYTLCRIQQCLTVQGVGWGGYHVDFLYQHFKLLFFPLST